MERSYAQRYARLYREHWWWRVREAAVLAVLRRLEVRGGRLLDVGCGDALFLPRLAEFGEVEGIEPDADLVSAESRRRFPIEIVEFERFERPPGSFRMIVMLDVLEHLDQPAAALSKARELLAPSGLLILTVPALPWLWTAHDDFNHHRRRFSRRALAALLKAAGFEVRELRYLFLWTVAGKLLLRLKEALVRRPPAPEEVPRPWLNRALFLLTRADLALGLRLPLPAGSSLLAVAVAPAPRNGERRAR